MSLYRRRDVWWYKFRFAGQMIRESSKSESKTIAKDAERARRRELEESWNQIKRRKLPPLFSLAAADWLKTRTSIASSTERSYKLAISQLTKDFGKQLLCDLCVEDVAAYQTRRKRNGVSNRTINLEVGVLRSILRRYRMWEAIAQDIDFLKEDPSPGRALTHEEEPAILDAASKSRCRSLYPVIMVGINTGMRVSEIRGLTWAQVDFLAKSLVVGKSKTEAGTGRIIPLNPRAVAVLTHWRGLFPGAEPEHYVFRTRSTASREMPENNAPMKSSPQNQCIAGKWPGRAHVRPQRYPAASTICATRSSRGWQSPRLRIQL